MYHGWLGVEIRERFMYVGVSTVVDEEFVRGFSRSFLEDAEIFAIAE